MTHLFTGTTDPNEVGALTTATNHFGRMVP
jgi:hypothetical protein